MEYYDNFLIIVGYDVELKEDNQMKLLKITDIAKIILGAIGLIGNGLIVLFFVKTWKMLTSLDLLLATVAALEFLSCLANLAVTLWNELISSTVLDGSVCKIHHFITTLEECATFFSVVMFLPLFVKYQSLVSKRICFYAIGYLLALSTVMANNISKGSYSRRPFDEDGHIFCIHDIFDNNTFTNFCGFRIFCVLISGAVIPHLSNNIRDSQIDPTEKMILVIISFYSLFVIPFDVMVLLHYNNYFKKNIFVAVVTINKLQDLMYKPIVYILLHNQIQNDFRRLFCCRREKVSIELENM